jgi:membrane dipeptidase
VSKLHDQLIVIDGLNVSNFGRSVFEDMHRGGVTASNCTSCVWENFTETMRNTAKWKTWLRENADLITQVYTTNDIRRAKTEHKTGIILGWQNSSGIEDRLDTLPCSTSLACASCN